jgi:hypothetical protein
MQIWHISPDFSFWGPTRPGSLGSVAAGLEERRTRVLIVCPCELSMRLMLPFQKLSAAAKTKSWRN